MILLDLVNFSFTIYIYINDFSVFGTCMHGYNFNTFDLLMPE